jgi:hypothetical protein
VKDIAMFQTALHARSNLTAYGMQGTRLSFGVLLFSYHWTHAPDKMYFPPMKVPLHTVTEKSTVE